MLTRTDNVGTLTSATKEKTNIFAYILKLYTGASEIKWPQQEIRRQVILLNE